MLHQMFAVASQSGKEIGVNKVYTHLYLDVYTCTKTKYFTIAVCHPSCQNGGQCVRPNQCDCTDEWEGHICDEGKGVKISKMIFLSY